MEKKFLEDTLLILHVEYNFSLIIHGGAKGADSAAGKWGRFQGIPSRVYPADWSKGDEAGPLRNQQMLSDGRPDLVIIFPGGKGTKDMMSRAYRQNYSVIECNPGSPIRVRKANAVG